MLSLCFSLAPFHQQPSVDRVENGYNDVVGLFFGVFFFGLLKQNEMKQINL